MLLFCRLCCYMSVDSLSLLSCINTISLSILDSNILDSPSQYLTFSTSIHIFLDFFSILIHKFHTHLTFTVVMLHTFSFSFVVSPFCCLSVMPSTYPDLSGRCCCLSIISLNYPDLSGRLGLLRYLAVLFSFFLFHIYIYLIFFFVLSQFSCTAVSLIPFLFYFTGSRCVNVAALCDFIILLNLLIFHI